MCSTTGCSSSSSSSPVRDLSFCLLPFSRSVQGQPLSDTMIVKVTKLTWKPVDSFRFDFGGEEEEVPFLELLTLILWESKNPGSITAKTIWANFTSVIRNILLLLHNCCCVLCVSVSVQEDLSLLSSWTSAPPTECFVSTVQLPRPVPPQDWPSDSFWTSAHLTCLCTGRWTWNYLLCGLFQNNYWTCGPWRCS